MADLKLLQRWVAFVPDLGNNRSLPPDEQLVLEVASSLTREELMAFRDAINAPPAEGETPDAARIRVLGKFLRLVGTHNIGGKEVKTFADYVNVCLEMADQYNLREVFAAVGYFNSISSADALFSERLSGGTAFTLHRSAAQDGS